MALFGLRRSTLVDASVNLVPFAILVSFLALVVGYSPWPATPRSVLLAVALHLVPIVVLLGATAAVAWVIQADEEAGS